MLLVIWFVLRSQAKVLLERLGLPEGATAVAAIRVVGPDGPMPEIATLSFQVAGDETALRGFYRERCKQVGLDAPDREALQVEPDLLCQRRGAGQGEAVLLSVRCEQATCSASVEVRY